MKFSKSVARIAFAGQVIKQHPELRVIGTGFTQKHADAFNTVASNYDAFRAFIMEELDLWPLTKQYFEHMVTNRLQQNDILASDFVSRLISEENPLEERLRRIHGKVRNLESITQDVGISNDPTKGEDSDEILLDLWNEIFVIDRILSDKRLGFDRAERVIRGKGQPQVDLIAYLSGISYAIEITRIRKRDFQGSTQPNMFDALYEKDNLQSLQNVLRNKLNSKNRQMTKFCESETSEYDRRLLVIKTSQWEYQDGSQVVFDETRNLLNTGNYSSIDEVLLVYDVEKFDWIK